MDQLHSRSSDEQIKVLFRGYCHALLSKAPGRKADSRAEDLTG